MRVRLIKAVQLLLQSGLGPQNNSQFCARRFQLLLQIRRVNRLADLFLDGFSKHRLTDCGADDIRHQLIYLLLFNIGPERAAMTGRIVCVFAIIVIPCVFVFAVRFGNVAV